MNLGTVGVNALQELRGNPHFDKLRESVADAAHTALHNVLEVPAEARSEATGYARAVRDMWRAMESGATGVVQRAVGPTKDGKLPRKDAAPAPAATPAAKGEGGSII